MKPGRRCSRSWLWLSEVGNISLGCKGEGLNACGKDIALMTGQPSSYLLVGHGAMYTPTMPAVATCRQQDEGSGLPEHACARLTQLCLCLSIQQRKGGIFLCPLSSLRGSSHSCLRRGDKSKARFCRRHQLLMSLYHYP